MYCRYCGKQLSDEAIMCPECGTPTHIGTTLVSKEKEPTLPEIKHNSNNQLSIVGFFLSLFACVTGIILGSFMFATGGSFILVVIGSCSILPALTGISICILKFKDSTGVAKSFVIAGIILASFVLFYLFISLCVICTLV